MNDMLGRGNAIRSEDALNLILDSIPPSNPSVTRIRLEDSYGRILATDIIASEDLPGFTRSTVDGYAVVSEDTFGLPSYLEVVGEILMGQTPKTVLRRGQAMTIPTGGMLPDGADAVLMLEHASNIDNNTIDIQKSVAPGENVVASNDDIRKDTLVLTKGRCLRPQDVGVLAGLGYGSLDVYEPVRVAVISTGDEVIHHTKPLKPGFVRDTNSFVLDGLIRKEGAVTIKKGIVADDSDALGRVVREALSESDMVLISGGSSVGAKDMTERVISESGRVLLHGVSMRPGKPLVAGIAGNAPIFGLPGHPVAVHVCFDVFVKPALRKISGMVADEADRTKAVFRARLTKSVHSAPGRRDYVRVLIEESDNGVLLAVPVFGKSGLLSTLVRASGLLLLKEEELGRSAGDEVEVIPF